MGFKILDGPTNPLSDPAESISAEDCCDAQRTAAVFAKQTGGLRLET